MRNILIGVGILALIAIGFFVGKGVYDKSDEISQLSEKNRQMLQENFLLERTIEDREDSIDIILARVEELQKKEAVYEAKIDSLGKYYNELIESLFALPDDDILDLFFQYTKGMGQNNHYPIPFDNILESVHLMILGEWAESELDYAYEIIERKEGQIRELTAIKLTQGIIIDSQRTIIINDKKIIETLRKENAVCESDKAILRIVAIGGTLVGFVVGVIL